MKNCKKIILDHIIQVEGGYVDDAFDSGGKTKYGITEAVARGAGYTGDMKDLTYDDAFNIYSVLYWDRLKLDDVSDRSWRITEELADTAVNCGVSFAGKSFQRVLSVMNNRGKYWDDLAIDGAVGSKTIKAFNAYMDLRDENKGEEVMLAALNSLQGAKYISLAERRTKDERFVYGWFLNRIVL